MQPPGYPANAAIASGDWKVDGACDPALELSRAEAYLQITDKGDHDEQA